MSWRCLILAVAATIAAHGSAPGADSKPPPKDGASFGALKAPDVAEARKQAEAWLKSVKGDEAKFKAIWGGDGTLLEKVTATLVLGDPQAAKLLAEARDPEAPAPIKVPEAITDMKRPAFYRHGLALAYGKALTGRKVYEEALEALSTLKPEEALDPAAYFFHRAVCEHSLMLKDRADGSIDRLLVDVADGPERYRMVGALMHFDMLTWQDKDLGWIARKMDNVQRRLDLKRGGKQTQKMQKEVLVRLEEMIKEIENQQKKPGGA